MDDVSGNISKQWNKHFVVYMSNALLPWEMLDKQACVCFVSSSPHASPMELMGGLGDSISSAYEMGINTFDCKTKEEVMLVPYVLFFDGDNPMQAKMCSQGGLGCNHFCWTCIVGGNKKFKMSDIGYNSLFEVSKVTCHSSLFSKLIS